MKVKSLLEKATKEEQEQNTPLLVLPKTYIGLEYEWENTGKFPYNTVPETEPSRSISAAVRQYFRWHVDGSLREGGMEFTFPEPFAGTRILNATRAMDAAARAYGFTSSYRTSLHVHMDLSTMEYPEGPNKVAALYALVEPLLYKFIGFGRDGCNYCIPWYGNAHHYTKYYSLVNGFQKNAGLGEERAKILGQTLFQHKASFKYAGMNMFSLGQFGTFEFRQAPVSMQLDKIVLWINILMRMKQYASDYNWNPGNLMGEVKGLGYKEFIERVFKDQAAPLLKTTKNVEEDLKLGSLTLFHLNSLL